MCALTVALHSAIERASELVSDLLPNGRRPQTPAVNVEALGPGGLSVSAGKRSWRGAAAPAVRLKAGRELKTSQPVMA
jgi:hypothetical protein